MVRYKWIDSYYNHIYLEPPSVSFQLFDMSESIPSKGWQIAEWIFHVLFGAQHGSQNPVKPLDKCILLEMPTEILLQTFSYLPLPSQVCLAVSSKTLHRAFSSVLASKELRFPRMPRNGRTYVVTEEYNLRMALLIKLQNARWACCGRCQKLHPRREFSARQRKDCRHGKGPARSGLV